MGFMERQLKVLVPGPLGPWVTVYLDSLEGEARALSTRYETWRELRRLAEEYTEQDVADRTTIELERYLAIRCAGKSPGGVGRRHATVMQVAQEPTDDRQHLLAEVTGQEVLPGHHAPVPRPPTPAGSHREGRQVAGSAA